MEAEGAGVEAVRASSSSEGSSSSSSSSSSSEAASSESTSILELELAAAVELARREGLLLTALGPRAVEGGGRERE